jgi:hypothetical protein
MEEKIAELCEIEVELYLDYYNNQIKSYKAFTEKLESEKKNMINIVYDLLENGYDEEEILSEIKSLGAYYKKTPEFFGKDNDSSMYPSEYYETKKRKKYPFNERCGYTLSLVKRFFATRKAIKNEYAYQKSRFNNVDDGIREKIYNNMKSSKKKSKRKKKKKTNNKRKNN